ncbi:MAG: hypothetical protein K8R58_11010 [Bacteroidales bacterium]|nr:hypothetical protein [Bacteroidales bacterium]
MKTFLKILGIIVLVIIVLAIIIPLIFKNRIIEKVKEEANNNINAKIDFTDFGLSLFKSFPDFTLTINDLTVAGIDEFEDDTLANIKSFSATIDLMSVFKGEKYERKSINIEKPKLLIKILKNGKANYDIAKSQPDDVEISDDTETVDTSSFRISLSKFEIKNLDLIYDDASTNMYINIKNLYYLLKGDFTADFTSLITRTKVEHFTLNYGGVKYLNKALIEIKADLDADLKNSIYTFKENEIRLNELFFNFNGSVSMIEDDINLVLTYNTRKTEFKNILSLIPAIYAKDFATIETKGKFALDGFVKGIYNENTLPSFSLNLNIEDAMFKYPDLPKPVTNIALIAKITNRGGDADNTVIDVSKLHFHIAGSPIDIKLHIKTPVSDPEIDGHLKGKIDLTAIKEVYPLGKDEQLNGVCIADVSINGKMSSVENEEYENFTAIGSILIKGVNYKSSELPQTVEIQNAQLNFSPQYLDLVSFISKIGKSDLRAKGKLDNYLSYVFKDGEIKGNLKINSNYFNLNEFIIEETEASTSTSTSASSDTIALTVFEVPDNIEFNMNSKFGKLIYDNMEMDNVNGVIEIKDEKVVLHNLTMDMLDGQMIVNGTYSTEDTEKPLVDFNMNIKNFDIQKSYNTFGIIEKFAPIAKNTTGNFSARMNLNTALDNEMMPVYNSMSGKGELSTSKIIIKNINSLNKIADDLKIDLFRTMNLDKVDISFEFIDGKLIVKPFDIEYDETNANVGGWTSFDQTIDYTMNLQIPRNKFGKAANNVLNNLVSQANQKGVNISLGEIVDVNVLIGGTISNPVIKTSLKESANKAIDDIKKTIEDEINKKKEDIKKEAKERADKIIADADKKARQIIKEAEKQAENVRKAATNVAGEIRKGADKKATEIEKEGKKKGFIAEKLAKESAKEIRNEADDKANKLVNESKKESEAIINKAKKEADRIKKEAEEKAKKELEK